MLRFSVMKCAFPLYNNYKYFLLYNILKKKSTAFGEVEDNKLDMSMKFTSTIHVREEQTKKITRTRPQYT